MATIVDGIDYEIKQSENKMITLKKDIESKHADLENCRLKLNQLKRAKQILLGQPQKKMPPKKETHKQETPKQEILKQEQVIESAEQ